MLKEHGCPLGKKMGAIMSQLKLIWADSDFQLSADELLDQFYPELLEKLSSPASSPNKKQKKAD